MKQFKYYLMAAFCCCRNPVWLTGLKSIYASTGNRKNTVFCSF